MFGSAILVPAFLRMTFRLNNQHYYPVSGIIEFFGEIQPGFSGKLN